jgi:hypothetical protein
MLEPLPAFSPKPIRVRVCFRISVVLLLRIPLPVHPRLRLGLRP